MRSPITGTLMTDASDTNIDNYLNVKSFKHTVLDLDFSDTAAMTLSIRGSISDTAPDFNAAASDTNRWDVIQIIDLEDGSAIDGDTGIVIAADDHRLIELNTNGLNFICPVITAYTSGKANIRYSGYDNQ